MVFGKFGIALNLVYGFGMSLGHIIHDFEKWVIRIRTHMEIVVIWVYSEAPHFCGTRVEMSWYYGSVR